MKNTSTLKKANELFRKNKYKKALECYYIFLETCENEVLLNSVGLNASIALKRIADDDRYSIYNKEIEKIFRGVGAHEFKKIIANNKKLENFSSNEAYNPLVSIIMPTWNRGYIICDAIFSVLAQEYTNWELIICDDASDDDTKEKIQVFEDKRIKYFQLEKTNGASARNHGLRIASGEVVAFLDSDNIWSPEYLKYIVLLHSKKQVKIAYTGFIDAVIKNGVYQSAELKFRCFEYEPLSFRNYIDLNTVSIKREVYYWLNGFDPKLERQQDWDLIVRYMTFFTPATTDKALVLYRRNESWNQVTIEKKSIDTRSYLLEKNEPLKVIGLNRYTNNLNINLPVFSSLRSVAIKISAPSESVAYEWGDFHFAHQLGKALYKFGFVYRVDCQDSWYSEDCDINIVLRGRHKFDTSKSNSQLNLLWIISHPDRLRPREVDEFDHVFVASDLFAKKLQKVTSRKVTVLHQATDIAVFNNIENYIDLPSEIIFVGNSRNQFRKMVQWADEENIKIGLWGSLWEQFIPENKITGQYIDNSKLAKYYSSCKILLNDHWETMSNNGFVSNRIFDATACGCIIISDDVVGLSDLGLKNIFVVRSGKELKLMIAKILARYQYYKEMAEESRLVVLRKHTFLNRAEVIAQEINNIMINVAKK